jgi:hypothetical protein
MESITKNNVENALSLQNVPLKLQKTGIDLSKKVL